ncbi:hypothetical protein B5807_07558 [Epicoccum nigrum]|uniref:Uncharacterized protein n=1 Tax=Epicoccum nigrum TaxID=105696 RepID=A0A1Y2LTX2_EPING|nr:hypothetical protein B5807_07558 [Epicoccum nigrum]
MHPALLISLVLLLNFLSFLAGRNFEENKQDDQKMQLRIQMDKVKTEITTKDAQIEELRKELEAKEVDIAESRKENLSTAPTRHVSLIPSSPTESDESRIVSEVASGKESMATGNDKENVNTRNRGIKKRT